MTETILKLMAEGGSITILGTLDENGFWQFLIKKNEVCLYDLVPDELDGNPVITSGQLSSWDDAVRLLDQNSNWVRLCPVTIHPEFVVQILSLVEERGGASAVARWREDLDLEFQSISLDNARNSI